MDATVLWGGVHVATVAEEGLWVPVGPRASQLTGTNMSDALYADVVLTEASLPAVEVHSGWWLARVHTC